MTSTLVASFEQHPYLILFFGMLVAGEAFLFPAIYFALQGRLDMRWVFMMGLTSTLLSDMVWYAIGYRIPLARIRQWKVFVKRRDTLLQLESVLERQGLAMVFLSKFVYGTRTIAQVLAGSHRLFFPKYLAANLAGSVALLVILILMGHFVATSLASLEDLFLGAQISFVLFILVVLGVQLWIKRVIRTKFRW